MPNPSKKTDKIVKVRISTSDKFAFLPIINADSAVKFRTISVYSCDSSPNMLKFSHRNIYAKIPPATSPSVTRISVIAG